MGEAGRVRINHAQFFDGVTPTIYCFAIGGDRPAEKWLKDRKGRTLSADDINHYCRAVGALAEAPHRMAEIDHIVDQHGEWPSAFRSLEFLEVLQTTHEHRPPSRLNAQNKRRAVIYRRLPMYGTVHTLNSEANPELAEYYEFTDEELDFIINYTWTLAGSHE